MMRPANCAVCGVLFDAAAGDNTGGRGSPKKYCGDPCRRRADKRRQNLRYKERRRAQLVNCLECGEPIQYVDRLRKICSEECRQARGRRQGRKQARERVGLPAEKLCEVCRAPLTMFGRKACAGPCTVLRLRRLNTKRTTEVHRRLRADALCWRALIASLAEEGKEHDNDRDGNDQR